MNDGAEINGSDSWIRTSDLRVMSPARTTSPLYRVKLAGVAGFEPAMAGSKPVALGLLAIPQLYWRILLDLNQRPTT